MDGFKHPKGYYPLFWAFLLERAGYYGMRALVVVFMIKVLSLNTEKADNIYGWFLGAYLATPFLFSYLSDRLVGVKRSAVFSCALMAIGMVLLSLSSVFGSVLWLYSGLVVVAVGQGFFKLPMYVMIGDLYEDKNDPRRDSGFTLMLVAINVGAMIAPVVCGYLGERVSWSSGFLMAGLFCLSALPLVRMAKDFKYKKKKGISVGEKRNIYAMIVLAFFALVIWNIITNYSDTLNFVFKNSVGQYLVYGWTISSAWLPAGTVIISIAMAPLFAWLWVWLDKRGKNISTVGKLIVGFAVASFSFVVLYFVFLSYQRTGSINLWLLMFATVISSSAEYLVYPVALSLATKLSPAKIATVTLGVWFLIGTLGGTVSNMLMPEYEPGRELWIFTKPVLICVGAVIALFFIIKPLKRWMKDVH